MGKKMIMIAAGAVLLLGGGGAGAYFYFANPAEASVSDETKKKAAKDEEKKSFEFVELDPLILPIVDNDGVHQVVTLVVSLEVGGAESVDKVKKMTPRLKDAYIQDLYGVLNKHAALKGGIIQVAAIKKRLNMVTGKVMGDDEVVNDVLLQVVQQRPI